MQGFGQEGFNFKVSCQNSGGVGPMGNHKNSLFSDLNDISLGPCVQII